ncbi:MAG TPA: rod shape-determining protein RodA [Candidatus Binataceae bacterium]|nr:rod shape-determining protein RodA [Candidatus Binataceae bacterium]
MSRFDRRLVYHFDWTIFSLALGLAAVGVVSVLSVTWGNTRHALDPLVVRQLTWIAVGVVLMITVGLFDYRSLSAWAYVFYALTVILLGIVAVAGHSTGGSQRWINLGVFKLEPSEIAKLAVVLVMVHYLREEPPRGGWNLRHILIPGVLLAVPAVLVLKQPDLGTALILVLITATLIYAGGINWRAGAVLLLAAMLAAPAAWHYLKPYQRERLVSFLNPESDPLGSGYHIIQSEIAIGSGGAWGKGLFKGTQARLNFLPEQTTDFIFAVFTEEFGFAGSMLLLSLYVALIVRGTWIARHARDRFGALLALGVTGIVFWQVAINIGMATGMLPVVGITLPLVSYGGSSLIAMMTAMGVLISINTRRHLF